MSNCKWKACCALAGNLLFYDVIQIIYSETTFNYLITITIKNLSQDAEKFLNFNVVKKSRSENKKLLE